MCLHRNIDLIYSDHDILVDTEDSLSSILSLSKNDPQESVPNQTDDFLDFQLDESPKRKEMGKNNPFATQITFSSLPVYMNMQICPQKNATKAIDKLDPELTRLLNEGNVVILSRRMRAVKKKLGQVVHLEKYSLSRNLHTEQIAKVSIPPLFYL